MTPPCLSVSPSVFVWANATRARAQATAEARECRYADSVSRRPMVVVLVPFGLVDWVRLMVTFSAFLHALPLALGH